MPKSMRKARYAAGACALLLIGAGSVGAKVEGDTVVLGAAVSLTGKYSVNGKNTKDGYDLAVKRINEMGGVKVGGKAYKLKVLYYDDESTPARGAQLAERLINQDGVKFVLGAYASSSPKATSTCSRCCPPRTTTCATRSTWPRKWPRRRAATRRP